VKVTHDHTAHNRLVVLEDLDGATHGLDFTPVTVYLRIRWEDGGHGHDVVATAYGGGAKNSHVAYGHPGHPIPVWIADLIKEVV
jgi:hypothetical protein